jgi:hypothetical protein
MKGTEMVSNSQGSTEEPCHANHFGQWFQSGSSENLKNVCRTVGSCFQVALLQVALQQTVKGKVRQAKIAIPVSFRKRTKVTQSQSHSSLGSKTYIRCYISAL